MSEYVVIGGGLAGLSAAFNLARAGKTVRVLEEKPHLGGRTASWDYNGMMVESGLHRAPAFYRETLVLMAAAGIDLDEALVWGDTTEICIPNGPSAVYTLSLPRYPLRTLGNIFGRNKLCSLTERLALGMFFGMGLIQHALRPASLDCYSVYDYAKKFGVSDRAIERILVPMTEGLFFLPPTRYSAYVLFGLLAQGGKHPLRTGLAAFTGGMTKVLAEPLAEAIRQHGGTVETGCKVTGLLHENKKITGVQVGKSVIQTSNVVLATSLEPAQRLLRDTFGAVDWNKHLLSLKPMPAATFQMELNRPAWAKDRVVFAPGTCMTCFSEQSRTTFTEKSGRLSIILSEPEKRLQQSPAALLSEIISDAKRIGVDLEGRIENYRTVLWPSEFYYLTPGNEDLRPPQETPIKGLALAGDYTRQAFLTTMEGAVISGKKAAQVLMEKNSS
ncbi:MAG: FAD-dependent oxidoreductase [Cellvibrio sp.]|uniref:hydroxysqualene dehydroxylase n=1 Tax=Cellvibrio sp. TaxID=1965322 RepID=UPI0027162967|nr:FAD-dependent oxidoreductase [Cellvibrio sp.]